MVSLSHFFLELIKHRVVYLIMSMVLDCHFNLLEPIWMLFLYCNDVFYKNVFHPISTLKCLLRSTVSHNALNQSAPGHRVEEEFGARIWVGKRRVTKGLLPGMLTHSFGTQRKQNNARWRGLWKCFVGDSEEQLNQD